MNSKTILLAVLALVAFSVLNHQEASAQNNGYYPYIIARGVDRQIIRNTPIEDRPNRPFHFYGNTVRRMNNAPSGLQLPGFGILQPMAQPLRTIRVQRVPFFRR